MMPEAEIHQRVLFLDTNTLHYAKLFLSFSKEKDLPPFGHGTDDPVDLFKNTRGARGKTLDNFKKGHKIVQALQARSKAGERIEYSPITVSELVCGLLRGKAIVNAAKEGIPHRMWTRIDDHEILHRLDDADYLAIRNDAEGLSVLFDAAEITLNESDPKAIKDLWPMTRELLHLIFMDLGDSIVYASSLLAEADELATSDGYLRQAATKIQNPNGIADPDEKSYFHRIHSELKNTISNMIGIEATDVHLPCAVSL